jgi:hypothetical protein
MGLSITVGTCYYQKDSHIGSWRAICGSQAQAAGGDATITLSLMSSPTMAASAVAESTPPPDSSVATTAGDDVGPVLTSMETVPPSTTDAAPPSDGVPAPTQMVGVPAGNGSNINKTMAWRLTHSKLAPTGSGSPSPALQGLGTSGAGENGLEVRGLWGDVMKGLVLVGIVDGLGVWGFYLKGFGGKGTGERGMEGS